MKPETKLGIFTVLGLILFGFSLYFLGGLSVTRTYDVNIKFNDVSGLPIKAPVKLAGVEVGKVKKIKIEGEDVIVVAEIHDGVVEIKNIAREAGSRTKISVYSPSPEIDPVGACVGPKGSRVETIVAALGGEKIDIVHYSENPAEYVKEALSPSDVTSVTLLAPEKICRVIVPDDQLSLAIGKEGQNARLAAKLTGMKIDIKPESAAQ